MFNIGLIATLVVLIGLTFYKGRGVMYSLIIAFYPTAVIFKSFPYLQNVLVAKDTAFNIYLSQAGVFIVMFALLFFITRRLSHYDGTKSGIAGFLDAVLLSVSLILLVMTLTFHILPARDIYSLTADLRDFFKSGLGDFVCVLSPMIALMIVTRRG
ncbi:MAG: hypothetical protein WCQ00_02115 [bacterium]